MDEFGLVGLGLIIINFIISFKGLSNHIFLDKYKFEVDAILISKDYIRLISSGFLHVNWNHFIFNMLSLYAFSPHLEYELGVIPFLLLYFASLLGGNLLALYIHRNHGDYSAVGASGAISGLVFASIVLDPLASVGFIFIPFSIPGWLFGLLYMLYSIYGIKSKRDNIGHEAHLGGAMFGILIVGILHPIQFKENWIYVLVVILPVLVFMYFLISKPHYLLIDNHYFNSHQKHETIDHKYNKNKVDKQAELDRLLDKIIDKGIESLSDKELQKLKEYSK